MIGETCHNCIYDFVDCALVKSVDCCDWCICASVNLVVGYYLIMIISRNCTCICLSVICINYYVLVFYLLIMIDVKLTPSGFDRLPVCMNG